MKGSTAAAAVVEDLSRVSIGTGRSYSPPRKRCSFPDCILVWGRGGDGDGGGGDTLGDG